MGRPFFRVSMGQPTLRGEFNFGKMEAGRGASLFSGRCLGKGYVKNGALPCDFQFFDFPVLRKDQMPASHCKHI